VILSDRKLTCFFWYDASQILREVYFLVLNSLKTLKSNQKIKMTNKIAKIGIKIANKDIPIDVPVSTVDTNGLANPAVVPVEASRVVEVEVLMAVAVPPPAIIAKAQVMEGSKLATVDTITAVPAMVAKGMVITSNK
jgi:hypothetical protein